MVFLQDFTSAPKNRGAVSHASNFTLADVNKREVVDYIKTVLTNGVVHSSFSTCSAQETYDRMQGLISSVLTHCLAKS